MKNILQPIPNNIKNDLLQVNECLKYILNEMLTILIAIHERLGTVIKVNENGSFTAKMESISGNVTRDYDFTVSQLNRVIFAKMAHVLYKL